MNVRYEIWNISKLAKYIQNNESEIFEKGMRIIFQGFQYFGPNIISKISRFNKEKYSLSNLSVLEVQKEFDSNPIFYARFIVAILNSKIVGIIACQWIKEDNTKLPFWRYHEKWVDVHEDFRKQGISKNLIKLLDKSDFLKGHILQRSVTTNVGVSFFQRKVESYLTGKNYALIPDDYCRTFAPIEVGIYDSIGRKLK